MGKRKRQGQEQGQAEAGPKCRCGQPLRSYGQCCEDCEVNDQAGLWDRARHLSARPGRRADGVRTRERLADID